MNNLPAFLSQGGTATLILKQIPHTGRGYIMIRSYIPERLEDMMAECRSFCRMMGAEQCFAAWEDGTVPENLEHAYDILCMIRPAAGLPQSEKPFQLVPMQEDNDAVFQRIYNTCFREVSHSMIYDREQIQRIYREGQRAFLALDEQGKAVGIGELHGGELAAVALLPEYRGRGKDLTLTLLQQAEEKTLSVTVASDNQRAIKLYEKLGFTVETVESRWFRV